MADLMGGDISSNPNDTVDVENGVPSLAKYIKSDACQNIYVMLGAGVSTSAGIPDFRSPGTGLYSNLARLNLPYPEAVFQISFFRSNPKPFYVLAKELYPGRFRPTLAHSFIKLLADKDLLRICFTQNIDTLERRAGIPAHKIVEAHGSFATQRCIDCGTPYDDDKIKRDVLEDTVPQCDECSGYVKPDIVFFGESLPDAFSRSIPKLRSADLLFIMGTSLTVYPFAALANMVPSHCPRVLINLDEVGDIGRKETDFLLLGQCDDMVLKLAEELGWKDKLLKEWELTAASVEREDNRQEDKPWDEEKTLTNEVDELVDKVASSLTLSEDSRAQKGIQGEKFAPPEPEGGDGKDDGKATADSPAQEDISARSEASETKL